MSSGPIWHAPAEEEEQVVMPDDVPKVPETRIWQPWHECEANEGRRHYDRLDDKTRRCPVCLATFKLQVVDPATGVTDWMEQ